MLRERCALGAAAAAVVCLLCSCSVAVYGVLLCAAAARGCSSVGEQLNPSPVQAGIVCGVPRGRRGERLSDARR